eukprot:GHVU01213147.1.p3 GENE.GHVU01213147.1~~GHVU01213147.1.p3  ORF type:complete len:127 (+),score=12.79 GHVU01213147.1:208-588(+)
MESPGAKTSTEVAPQLDFGATSPLRSEFPTLTIPFRGKAPGTALQQYINKQTNKQDLGRVAGSGRSQGDGEGAYIHTYQQLSFVQECEVIGPNLSMLQPSFPAEVMATCSVSSSRWKAWYSALYHP